MAQFMPYPNKAILLGAKWQKGILQNVEWQHFFREAIANSSQ
jgi:hypothetical protein